MREEAMDYSLAELLDHPGLGLVMTGDGIERRCLDLMLDARSRDRQRTESAGDKSTGSSVQVI
jgi:hypothetical protein